MILRIIAITIVVCLGLGTLGLANGEPKSNLDTLKWERSIRTHIFLGMVVGLAGTGLAIINESARRPDESTTGWAIGIAVIGFGYAFYNWMRLQALG